MSSNSSQPRRIPFTKCHTDGNDFLIIESPAPSLPNPQNLTQNLCNRRTNIGADGLIIISALPTISSATRDGPSPLELSLSLYNSDGSKAEISGNGTCCVAAVVAFRGLIGVFGSNNGIAHTDGDRDGEKGEGLSGTSDQFIACTGAGRRAIRLLRRDGNVFHFMVEMGIPTILQDLVELNISDPSAPSSTAPLPATILNVGNPQCALLFPEHTPIPDDWSVLSRHIQSDTDRFPQGVNISFSRVVDLNTLETVFYERGAGETASSGTGSIGAAVAGIVRGVLKSPVWVCTGEGKGLGVRWEGVGTRVELEGHAEIVGEGVVFWDGRDDQVGT